MEFVELLSTKMLHNHHHHVSSFLQTMLRRDIISLLPKRGLDHVAENILSYLDAKSLCEAELVCKEWYEVISEGMLWKKLIERRVQTDSLWRRLIERQGFIKYLFKPAPGKSHPEHIFYRRLYPKIMQDIESLEQNWRFIGSYVTKTIHFQGENSENICCVQYDAHKIVTGSYDSTIKIWDRNTLECIQVLIGHTEAVVCLQFDDRVVISGSLDSTVRVWDVKSGQLINTLITYGGAVFHLRFNYGMVVTISEDQSVTVWNMVSPFEITIHRILLGDGDISAVDFDEKYIVSASVDGTINVWNTSTCKLVRTLQGHKQCILCLQYRDSLVVSGSTDTTIKVWDVESGACLRTLEGHEDFVSSIKFDNKRIVSGAYDGKIKVWDLPASLNPCTPAGALCLGTLVDHFGSVESLQFDDFQILSSSSVGTILVFDFLNGSLAEKPAMNVCQT